MKQEALPQARLTLSRFLKFISMTSLSRRRTRKGSLDTLASHAKPIYRLAERRTKASIPIVGCCPEECEIEVLVSRQSARGRQLLAERVLETTDEEVYCLAGYIVSENS